MEPKKDRVGTNKHADYVHPSEIVEGRLGGLEIVVFDNDYIAFRYQNAVVARPEIGSVDEFELDPNAKENQ